MRAGFTKYGLSDGTYSALDIWGAKSLGELAGVDQAVAPHGVLLLELRRQDSRPAIPQDAMKPEPSVDTTGRRSGNLGVWIVVPDGLLA